MTLSKNILVKILFAEIFILVFFSGFFPIEWISRLNSLMFILIYATCILVVGIIKKPVVVLAIISSIMQIITSVFEFRLLNESMQVLNIIFFSAVVALLILAVARAHEATSTVIFEAINGYLLMGIAFAAMVLLMCRIDPLSFSFAGEELLRNHNGIYYSFVTLTTLGYGDMLPHTPPAKSLSILIAVSGQLYLTVIIALLIGKYSNRLTSSGGNL